MCPNDTQLLQEVTCLVGSWGSKSGRFQDMISGESDTQASHKSRLVVRVPWTHDFKTQQLHTSRHRPFMWGTQRHTYKNRGFVLTQNLGDWLKNKTKQNKETLSLSERDSASLSTRATYKIWTSTAVYRGKHLKQDPTVKRTKWLLPP